LSFMTRFKNFSLRVLKPENSEYLTTLGIYLLLIFLCGSGAWF
jgi:preprotein translocase subunit Sss1